MFGKLLIQVIGLCLVNFFLTSSLEASHNKQLTYIRHVYLTWQKDPTRTITINIHGLNTPDELNVYYDSSPKLSKVQAYQHCKTGVASNLKLPDGRKIYHIELKDLVPGQFYYFTVGDGSHSLIHEQKFRTIPEDYEDLIIVEGGDWENTANAELLAQRAGEYNPAAVFLGGDYPTGVLDKRDYKKWDLWLDNFRKGLITAEGCLVPMVLAIGNHEVIGGFGKDRDHVPFFFDYFPQANEGKSFFSLNLGSKLKIFVLDSGHTAPHQGAQVRWLENELAEARKIPVKMAIYHVPLYPTVRFAEKNAFYFFLYGLLSLYDKAQKADKLFSFESHEGRKHWGPLFDRYQLTVAFEHHDQTLKRTKLLKNGKEDPYGTLYLGDGGWGPKVQYPAIQSFFSHSFAKVKGKVHFFWLITLKEDQITYKAINPQGEIIDQFVQKLF